MPSEPAPRKRGATVGNSRIRHLAAFGAALLLGLGVSAFAANAEDEAELEVERDAAQERALEAGDDEGLEFEGAPPYSGDEADEGQAGDVGAGPPEERGMDEYPEESEATPGAGTGQRPGAGGAMGPGEGAGPGPIPGPTADDLEIEDD